jgi:hypothetical protein
MGRTGLPGPYLEGEWWMTLAGCSRCLAGVEKVARTGLVAPALLPLIAVAYYRKGEAA